MTTPRCVSTFFLLLAFLNLSAAQSVPRITVDENRTTARINGSQIEFLLRVHNPASERAVHLKVDLLDTADSLQSTHSADIRVQTGETAIPIRLQLPKSGDAKQLQWSRVRYSLTFSGSDALTGILSLGAITENLFELRVAYPR